MARETEREREREREICGSNDDDDDGDIHSYLPTPPLGQDMTQGQFFKRSLAGLNSEFSFS